MTAMEFAKLCKAYHDELVDDCSDIPEQSHLGQMIAEMSLDPSQSEQLKKVIKEFAQYVLTDCIYGLLLGLDGCSNIGGELIEYKLYDDEDNLIAGDCGQLEGSAYEVFHGNQD